MGRFRVPINSGLTDEGEASRSYSPPRRSTQLSFHLYKAHSLPLPLLGRRRRCRCRLLGFLDPCRPLPLWEFLDPILGCGVRYGGNAEEAEDQDCVHPRSGVEVCWDGREAPEGGDECSEVQLFPRIPRVPPGNPKQRPHRDGEHRNPLRRHARHKGLFWPPVMLFSSNRRVSPFFI